MANFIIETFHSGVQLNVKLLFKDSIIFAKILIFTGRAFQFPFLTFLVNLVIFLLWISQFVSPISQNVFAFPWLQMQFLIIRCNNFIFTSFNNNMSTFHPQIYLPLNQGLNLEWVGWEINNLFLKHFYCYSYQ